MRGSYLVKNLCIADILNMIVPLWRQKDIAKVLSYLYTRISILSTFPNSDRGAYWQLLNQLSLQFSSYNRAASLACLFFKRLLTNNLHH